MREGTGGEKNSHLQDDELGWREPLGLWSACIHMRKVGG